MTRTTPISILITALGVTVMITLILLVLASALGSLVVDNLGGGR